ncbi:MAG: hypothetical protein HY770_08140 [Chitinivibrionia bacterium]|nr:hypothetical protein [Chitinivibrionia bacterium]
MQENDTSNTIDYAKAVREMIAHEDELLNNRMNWLLVVQGLLFAAYSSAASSRGFAYVLIALGFLISISSKIAFIASDRAIRNLLSYWDEHLESTNRRWRDFPPVFGAAIDKSIFMRLDSFLSPRSMLPWAFAAGWIVILILKLKG